MKRAFIDYTTDPATYYDRHGHVLEEGVVIKYVSTGKTYELVRTEDGNLGYDATNPKWVECGKAAPFEYGVYPLEQDELSDIEIETTVFRDYQENTTETDIEAVRLTAELFLDQPVIQNEDFPFIVTHPFASSTMMPYKHDFVDITSADGENKWKEQMRGIIYSSNLYHIVNILMNKPYRLQFLKHAMYSISPQDFGDCLRQAWISTENISMQTAVSSEELIAMFQYADVNTLMDDDELKMFKFMKTKRIVTIYRGVTGYNLMTLPDAMSYTDDIRVAEWFANRYHQDDGQVIKMKIDPNRILAYFTCRNESEVVINPYE